MTSRLNSKATIRDIPFQLNDQPTRKAYFIYDFFSGPRNIDGHNEESYLGIHPPWRVSQAES